MGKLLIIAEKPSVAADIARALGGFGRQDKWLESSLAIVSSAIGHLVEIHAPEAETTGKDLATLPVIPSPFSLRPLDRTMDQYRLLCRLMSRPDVDGVVNACDAGREGELIFRLIYEAAGCRKPVKRMWLQSMTQDAIKEAYARMRPGADFDNLAHAARCRSEADWLIGINTSRGVTRLKERATGAAASMSAGRVQTPTLAIVVNRELEIRNFVPKDYWEVHGTFTVSDGNYIGKWQNLDPNRDKDDPSERIWDKAKAQAIASKCHRSPDSVTEESKPTTSGAPKLYDLTSLQRQANKLYGFSAKKTLELAQALYETHKVATYPRTDSCHLPEDYIPTATQTMRAMAVLKHGQYAKQVLDQGWIRPDKRIFNNAKISDHFAIIPTGKAPENLSGDEEKLFDMIVKRFIAAFFPAAEYLSTTRLTVVAGETFKSTGRVLVSPGWLAVYGTQADDDEKTPPLCKYQAGEPVATKSMTLKSLQTKPPTRFTEDTLLGAMENAGKLVDDDELRDAMKERGLGTPATRAATIDGLLSAKDGAGRPKEPYLNREGKQLVPTPKAIDLIQFLSSNGVDVLVSPKMTGDWEFKLRQMEKGALARDGFMAEIVDLTRSIIDTVRAKASTIKLPTTNAPCPKCSGSLSVGPRAIACEGCGFQVWRVIAGRIMSIPELERLIRDGAHSTLTGFVSKEKKAFSAGLKLDAEFKVVFSFDSEVVTKDPNGKDVHCPKCQSLMRRIEWKGSHFWGCTDRVSCKTNLRDNNGFPMPPDKTKPCPLCSRAMNLRRSARGYFWGCSGFKTNDCNNIVNADDSEIPEGGLPLPAQKTSASAKAGAKTGGKGKGSASSRRSPARASS